MDLARLKCEACAPGTLPIDFERANDHHQQLDDSWKLEPTRIVREFSFRNFRDPFGLATRIALLAEQEGHHPDLEISWGRLVVSLTTHAANGLTDNDFILAAKIDKLN
ncbi:MAG: 4a-hydroxytetrahydrobiopterin dehydratase [Actinomycetota bacterium]